MVLVKSQITEQSGQSAVEQNTVTGTNALVLTIKDLNTAAPIVDGLLADPVNLSKIGKIEVYGDEHHEEEGGEKDTQAVVVNEENEGSVSRSAFYQATKENPKLLEVRTARLCEPIVRLLSVCHVTMHHVVYVLIAIRHSHPPPALTSILLSGPIQAITFPAPARLPFGRPSTPTPRL